MLEFDPSKLEPKRLSELKERQLFLHQDMSSHVLAVVIATRQTEQLICHLNGKRAFHLESINTRINRFNVIELPVSIESLSLRVDIAGH